TCQRSGGRVGLVEADQRLPRRRLKVPAVVVRPRRRARRGARPPAPLAERINGWLRAPVRAPEAEVALVGGAIERRLGPDRSVVVGVAPHQATDRARGVEARERVLEVPRCLVLGQEGRGALSLGIVVARGRAELREEDIPPAQPTHDVSEECDELRCGSPSAPRRVNLVPEHAEDIADPRSLGWPNPPVILEVLHVQPEGDRARSVRGSDGSGDPLEPAHAVLGGQWHAAVRVLIAEIPRPQGGMGRESAGALAREQGLRLEDERVHVPVAHPPLQDVIVRDDAKPSALGIAREGPQGHEVRATHVTREERGDDLETMRSRLNRSATRARTARRSRAPMRPTASIAPATSSTTKPVNPSSTTSRTAPRPRAITGVPHAIASIIERPKGSANSTKWSSASADPSSSS